MNGRKVVFASDLRSKEALAFSQKVDEEMLVKEAGKKVALHVTDYLVSHHLEKKITLLAGIGNNGADGFAASCHLLKQGFSVKALLVGKLEMASELCQRESTLFLKMGGTILEIEQEEEMHFFGASLLIDALLGTGFKGDLKEKMKALIEKANQSSLPIISVDIPSGLDGDTGEKRPIAIRATKTITFSLPKAGFFLLDGWNFVGDLCVEKIGLPQEYLESIEAPFLLIEEEHLKQYLPKIERTQNKYERGSVVAIAGSLGMEGAAKLSSLAALRSGAGMVRLFLPSEIKIESATFPPEVVKKFWQEDDLQEVGAEVSRASSAFIGPGLGRSRQVENLIDWLLPQISVPCVIDADGLFVLAHHPHLKLPSKTILTPHQQEMERLLGKKKEVRNLAFLALCQTYCEKKDVILILKGSCTFIFHPHQKPLLSVHGDPSMATAGSGDVLTGILSALLAQKVPPYPAAVLGVYLHGICGEMAAVEKGSFSVIAEDLIEMLPQAFKKILQQ